MSRFARFRWYHTFLILPWIMMAITFSLTHPVDRMLAGRDQRDIGGLYEAVEKAFPRNDPALEWVQVIATQEGTEVRAHVKENASRQDARAYRSLLEGFLGRRIIEVKPDQDGVLVYETTRRYYHSIPFTMPGSFLFSSMLFFLPAGLASLTYFLIGVLRNPPRKVELARIAAKYGSILLTCLGFVALVLLASSCLLYSSAKCRKPLMNYYTMINEIRSNLAWVQTINLPENRASLCEEAVAVSLFSHTGQGSPSCLADSCLPSGPGDEREPVYNTPAFDDFYLRMGTVLVQCAPTEAEPLRVRVAYDLSFEPYCGHDGLMETYITPG